MDESDLQHDEVAIIKVFVKYIYIYNAFKEVKNTKEFWSLLKKVKDTNADPNIGTLQDDEELVTDTSQKAETLNESFSNVEK